MFLAHTRPSPASSTLHLLLNGKVVSGLASGAPPQLWALEMNQEDGGRAVPCHFLLSFCGHDLPFLASTKHDFMLCLTSPNRFSLPICCSRECPPPLAVP